ncbi:hypothetical protein H6F95_04250 [Cyanobacteria bacterium FACHB-471]|nr:hypothetical protein [Cyanobacteria bacterium FACHB-471]
MMSQYSGTNAKARSGEAIVQKVLKKSTTEIKTEIYQRYLRKSGWRFCESSFLWDILVELQRHFPNGFTRAEEFEYLVERFKRHYSRSHLRAAIYILYRSGTVKKKTEILLTTDIPASERVLSKKVDALLIERLIGICKAHQLAIEVDGIIPLLVNSYTAAQLKTLLSNAQLLENDAT